MDNITNIVVDPAIKSISFHQFETPVFNVKRLGTVIGIWESDMIDGGEDLLAWKSIIFSCTKTTDSDIYVFISNHDSTTESTTWIGPYRNATTSMVEFTKRYMKIRAVLIQRGVAQPGYGYNTSIGPSIDSLTLKCVASGSASKFFTKAYEIGFSPQRALIVAQTDIPEGAMIRFGVANLDTLDLTKYQFFNLNEITKLNRLPVTGRKIKIYIEMSGNSGEQIVVHEFAIMFSGELQSSVNML